MSDDAGNLNKSLANFEKIILDTPEKLETCNAFLDCGKSLTLESIAINVLIKQVKSSLLCLKRRKLILEAKHKVIAEYAKAVHDQPPPPIFSSKICIDPEISNLDLNYVYSPEHNILHLANEIPSTPATPNSINYDDDDNLLISAFSQNNNILNSAGKSTDRKQSAHSLISVVPKNH